MIELRGIAWNHSRGFTSVVATAQRFEELHPEVRITWEKRSLQAFADSTMGPRYAPAVLQAGGLVTFNGRHLRSTLCGAGLAISAKTAHARIAADYVRYTAEPETQRGLYFETGGQPSHRAAWTDASVNAASPLAHAFVSGKAGLKATIESLHRVYCESLQIRP